MDIYQYWIGRNINLEEVWKAYQEGIDYTKKYNPEKYFELKLHFGNFERGLPLYNFEAIQKTLKSTYHDIKFNLLSREEYNIYGPMFFNYVDRGSGIWSTFVEKIPALLYVFGLCGAISAYAYFDNQTVESLDRKLKILNEYFPDASVQNQKKFLDAWNFFQRNKAVKNMIDEKLYKIELSKDSISTADRNSLITIHEIGNK